MMSNVKHLEFLILLFIAGCNAQPLKPDVSRHPISPQAASNVLDTEETAVLEAVISHLGNAYRIRRLVVGSETDYEDLGGGPMKLRSVLRKRLAGIKSETMEAFLQSQRVQKTIPSMPNVSGVLTLVNKAERIRKIYEAFNQGRNGWDEFVKEYPGSNGLTTLSRVGFDAGHRQALIFRATLLGIDGGGGVYMLLDKVRNKWVVVNEMTAWVG